MTSVSVSPAMLIAGASALRGTVAHWAHVRAQAWPSVSECGSAAVTTAIDGLSSWYRATWARTDAEVEQLAERISQAAMAYASADSQVASAALSMVPGGSAAASVASLVKPVEVA